MEDWSLFTNNWDMIWKSFVVFFAALFLLRLAGRKTIADMLEENPHVGDHNKLIKP
ncbi:hypothetical protein [Litchfieldia alkalitelluris]|uniref:hypothetical protein n=1 Tax=Litchfieldia alkalitelluris TaxID=304268 RepID=UPI001472C4C0|nr:hypothetical protein [Litchfieldia alkalitelluris]